ncbi:MAG: sigma-70 family RNA polymerase sigma factor [Actinomycetota bacterium]|nr:sigma-70 family RNA polymerase sigma factor [Actinomycetota bacterium]
MTDADAIRESLVNAATFAVLFDRHYRAVHRFLRARIGAALAEDLASETFTIAFRRRFAYDLSRPDAAPWLYGIAVNLVREERRTEERRLRAYARSSPADDPEYEIQDWRLDGTVAAALLELPLEDRNLILLHAWAQLSYDELATALGLPLGTVRSRLSRTRSKLRAALAAGTPLQAGEQA